LHVIRACTAVQSSIVLIWFLTAYDKICLLFCFVDFKSNTTLKIGRLPNVNLYQLMCHVMQLVPAPNNGTWSAVCDGLADDEACTKGAWRPADIASNAPSIVDRGAIFSIWFGILAALPAAMYSRG